MYWHGGCDGALSNTLLLKTHLRFDKLSMNGKVEWIQNTTIPPEPVGTVHPELVKGMNGADGQAYRRANGGFGQHHEKRQHFHYK